MTKSELIHNLDFAFMTAEHFRSQYPDHNLLEYKGIMAIFTALNIVQDNINEIVTFDNVKSYPQ